MTSTASHASSSRELPESHPQGPPVRHRRTTSWTALQGGIGPGATRPGGSGVSGAQDARALVRVRRGGGSPTGAIRRRGGRRSQACGALLAPAFDRGRLRVRPALAHGRETPSTRARRRRRVPRVAGQARPSRRRSSTRGSGPRSSRRRLPTEGSWQSAPVSEGVRAPSPGRASRPSRGKQRGRAKPQALLFSSRQPAPSSILSRRSTPVQTALDFHPQKFR